ncbi:phosphatidylethanolamine-binding protein [Immersiella caudata]|uniref:Phosphatidylethanolamine-binding protein n=1 Tax=Immersiella caudata TaxID=314043 RepID=A0AA40C6P3_9PEZI|nr:phosphatidylethanolamine-binding protein [Immersiella caudata]
MAAATVSHARTPPGFLPATQNDLIVEFNGFIAMSGTVVPRNTTIPQPRIGTLTRLAGRSYAVLMIDLDIPTDTPPQTNTLLHWAQTGLTPANTPTRLNTTTGQISVFLLENSTNTAPILGYFGPNPPARIPLSHRYTQILIDTSDADADDIAEIRSAAATIRGFNALTVLTEADLEDKVVAGNFFNVTNPGPVNGTGTPSGTGTGTGTGSGPTATPAAGGRLAVPVSLMAFVAGAVFFGL